MHRQESAVRRSHAATGVPLSGDPPAATSRPSTARALFAARTELAETNEALRRAHARCAELAASEAAARREAEEARWGLSDATEQELARLAAASHDLRDPLQVIASHVDLLADGFCGPVTGEQRDYLTRIRGHVHHLAAVVDSIVALARAEHRGLAPKMSEVPLPELLAQAHALVEPFAAARGVSVVVDYERAPTAIRGERTALLRVLANLAGNAVKFTPRGGQVWVSALAVPGAVELHVADTGPGVPRAQAEAIFEPFVQAHPTDETYRPGAGLGLAIARGLTRLMGGELFVHAIGGGGSLFTARFPEG